jgi:O-antigen/teichoic acid export membrane protein
MAAVRRAFLLSSAERYVATVINLAVTVIIARLLTPGEFGLSVLGSAALMIADVIRDMGTSVYLVQHKQLSSEKIRTAFTVALVLTLSMVGLLIMLAEPIAEYYGLPGLKHYLQVTAGSFLLGPFVSPIYALLRRDMLFGAIAVVNVVTSLLNAAVVIWLSILGFSYMSFAWANLVSGTTGLLLLLYCRSDFSIFRPSFGALRSVFAFGPYYCYTAAVGVVWDFAPYLIFGRTLSVDSVGLYHRANLVCRLPEGVLLAGINPVVLPTFAAHARQGRSLKESYLQAIELITAVLWPALVLFVFLAHPFVLALLGQQWLAIVPLVQIIAAARLFAFTASLDYPMLLAVGAIRHAVPLRSVQVGVSLTVIALAAGHGLLAVAFSCLFTVPFNSALSVCLVRAHVVFQWREFVAATRKSAAVTVFCVAGPLIVVLTSDSPANVSVGGAIIALMLSTLGWVIALWLTDHPALEEIRRGRNALLSSAMMAIVVSGRSRFLHRLLGPRIDKG